MSPALPVFLKISNIYTNENQTQDYVTKKTSGNNHVINCIWEATEIPY